MDDRTTRVQLAGVEVDPLDGAAVRAWLRERIGKRRRPGSWVCTVNLDYLVIAARDAAFRSALATADMAVADGVPLVWLSHLAGTPLPARVAGSDLTTWVVDGGVPDARTYLLGSTDDVCAAVARRARRAGGQIAGWMAPPRAVLDDPEQSQAIVAEINRSRADILLVALGAPRQDLWLARNRDALNVSVMVGVGGSLDFAAGRIRRAPGWVQRMGFEWGYRLLQEPRRLWRRYLVDDLPFLAGEAARTLRRRVAR